MFDPEINVGNYHEFNGSFTSNDATSPSYVSSGAAE